MLAALPELASLVEQDGLRVELTVEGEPRPLPPDVEVAAYRIVQEALTNCVKHAGAMEVIVQLQWGEDELSVAIEDEGRVPSPRRHSPDQGLVRQAPPSP